MYLDNINIDAIRTIDTIIQTPKVQYPPTTLTEVGSSPNASTGQDLQELVDQASEALEVVNTEISFRIHEGTGRPVIQLVELVSKEVIREIPPEKMLDVVAGIWEWAGLIVDRKE